MALEWELVTNPTPPNVCGDRRGPRSLIRCELPPDHMVGRLPGPPVREYRHVGRSGSWFSWPPAGEPS